MSAEQTAEVLGISPITVLRDRKLAKAWILGRLSEARHNGACALAGN